MLMLELFLLLVFGGLSYWDLELWKRRRGLRLDVVWDSRVLGRVCGLAC